MTCSTMPKHDRAKTLARKKGDMAMMLLERSNFDQILCHK